MFKVEAVVVGAGLIGFAIDRKLELIPSATAEPKRLQ